MHARQESKDRGYRQRAGFGAVEDGRGPRLGSDSEHRLGDVVERLLPTDGTKTIAVAEQGSGQKIGVVLSREEPAGPVANEPPGHGGISIARRISKNRINK